MKSRDIIGLVFAFMLVAVTGILIYTQLAPPPKGSGIVVIVPQKVTVPLSNASDQDKLGTIKGLTDYSVPQRCDDNPDLCDRKGAPPI